MTPWSPNGMALKRAAGMQDQDPGGSGPADQTRNEGRRFADRSGWIAVPQRSPKRSSYLYRHGGGVS
jgi:hypothetical protein